MKKRANKNKRQKRNQGFSFIHVLAIMIIVAGLTFLCLSFFVPSKKKEGEDNKPLDTAINETEKKREEEKKKQNEGDNQDKTPAQYDGDKPISADSFNASITRNEVANGKYALRINIYELVSDGSCSLHMEANGGQDTLDKTVKIVNAGPESSSCEGFDIPVEGISSGSYKFTVTIEGGSKKSELSGVINI